MLTMREACSGACCHYKPTTSPLQAHNKHHCKRRERGSSSCSSCGTLAAAAMAETKAKVAVAACRRRRRRKQAAERQPWRRLRCCRKRRREPDAAPLTLRMQEQRPSRHAQAALSDARARATAARGRRAPAVIHAQLAPRRLEGGLGYETHGLGRGGEAERARRTRGWRRQRARPRCTRRLRSPTR